MNDPPPSILCVDAGNTNVRFGILRGDAVSSLGEIGATSLLETPSNLADALPREAARAAFCSVVPTLDARLEHHLLQLTGSPPFRLTHLSCPALPIRYPAPAEIGQDRLANALAARTYHGAPAIVIDVGTAATFDLVSAEGGYEGGVILPGPQALVDCLLNRAALLPRSSLPDEPPEDLVGRTTADAIAIGASHGFPAMIRDLLPKVKASLARIDPAPPKVILTGGGAFRLRDFPDAEPDPDLTLKGLWLAASQS
mgnify:CR=1 FL=1